MPLGGGSIGAFYATGLALGICKSAVVDHIDALGRRGAIERRGPRNGGVWLRSDDAPMPWRLSARRARIVRGEADASHGHGSGGGK
jgi:hypothetical protein